MRRRPSGFGIVETLMALFLVGIVLGLVARGYQAMSRLNLATYQMSQRMELTSFLQRLAYEVSGAIELTIAETGFRFQQLDPTLNLNYHQTPPARLPWPIPQPPPESVDLFASSHLLQTDYSFDSGESRILRTAYGETSTAAADIGQMRCASEAGGRILDIEIQPKEMTAPVRARIFLPMVREGS